jgi:hypothetical protein
LYLLGSEDLTSDPTSLLFARRTSSVYEVPLSPILFTDEVQAPAFAFDFISKLPRLAQSPSRVELP